MYLYVVQIMSMALQNKQNIRTEDKCITKITLLKMTGAGFGRFSVALPVPTLERVIQYATCHFDLEKIQKKNNQQKLNKLSTLLRNR